MRACVRLILIYDLVIVICYSEEASAYCSWFARKLSVCRVKCIGYIGLVFGFEKLAWYFIHIALRFKLPALSHFVLMKGPRALIKYIVFNFVFRSSFKQNATYKYLFIILLDNCKLELIHIALLIGVIHIKASGMNKISVILLFANVKVLWSLSCFALYFLLRKC